MKIGILAIQGSVIEHRRVLEKLGCTVQEVRLPEDLEHICGLIMPGGESTTQSKLLKEYGLFEVLKKKIQSGLPVWGSCAGAILLAKKVEGKNPPKTLGVMDIVANRNWYGGQLDSFVVNLTIHDSRFTTHELEGVFIRAPKLGILKNADVKVLAEHDSVPVLLRQKNMLVTSFHPELTDDTRVHEYFLEMCA